MQLPLTNQKSNDYCSKKKKIVFTLLVSIGIFSIDFGHARIKEMIRTLENNSRQSDELPL